MIGRFTDKEPKWQAVWKRLKAEGLARFSNETVPDAMRAVRLTLAGWLVKDRPVQSFPELVPSFGGLPRPGRDLRKRGRGAGRFAHCLHQPLTVLLFFLHVQLKEGQVLGREFGILL